MVKGEKRRLIFFFLTIILLPILAIFTRLFSLQVLRQERKDIGIDEEILEDPRGTIYDQAGRVLAISIETDSLYADPKEVVLKEAISERLSAILNIDRRKILKRLKSRGRFVWLKRKMNPKERARVEALRVKGLGFIKEHRRIYPKGELASHLLGFVGLDNQGLEGIEVYFDNYLRGKTKKFKVVKDGRGKIVRVLPGIEEASTFMGCDIVLTIDEVVQHIAETELKKAIEKYKAKGGSVVIMDPKTGKILALAVGSPFDLNQMKDSKSVNWRNWAITDTFEPGSTFKPIIFAIALKEKVIDLREKIHCDGFIMVANHKINCHKEHGEITLAEALEKSCNVGTIKVGLRLDPKAFYKHMKAFGFGNITGITLPGEASGSLRRPSSWSGLSRATLSIGQEILVTPIQLAVAISALANGGYIMEPLVVSSICDKTGRVIKEFKSSCIRQVISNEALMELKDLLEGVVLRGTGQKAQIFKYHVYGKTGTAQKFDKLLGRYSKDKFISSFIGWIEAERKKILILVVIDEPKGVYWGSEVAAPVFRSIGEKILPYLGIFPEGPVMIQNVEPVPVKTPNSQVSLDSPLVMPDLSGMSMRGVHRLLGSYNLKVVFEGSGLAVSQSPLPGVELKPGMRAFVRFEGG